ncbi:LLM class flavin-dependent oxidoreductase [Microvirga zambiensis]|uniref:LLM class flavin-dependent oxidoreductase n=1 Tax=Microvirga zambiensis TaxID=1402137 RepID=UPI00191D359D|nr:LLM class flavin-dependent oxidoreductase [Microvirga zambiensis]
MADRRRVRIAAQYNAEDPFEIWHPDLADELNTEDSFRKVAAVYREGLFDFYFQAETAALPMGEKGVPEFRVMGRLDNLVTQSYLASLYPDLGFVATINTGNNLPYDLARRLHTFDILTNGRSGWNVVLGGNPHAHVNHRPKAVREKDVDRYVLGLDIVHYVLQALGGEGVGPQHGFAHYDQPERLLPPNRQGAPFTIQAGDSGHSRDLATSYADGMYTHYSDEVNGPAFYKDIHDRLKHHGRQPDTFKIYSRLAILVGNSAEDALERHKSLLRYQLHDRQVRSYAEQIWGKRFAELDPEGPLPEESPTEGHVVKLGLSYGLYLDGPADKAVARLRRISAERGGAPLRETLIFAAGTHYIMGSPVEVATELRRLVDLRATDGFVIAPHSAPHWLEPFVRLVVPVLQDWGVYAKAYHDETLRERVLREC